MEEIKLLAPVENMDKVSYAILSLSTVSSPPNFCLISLSQYPLISSYHHLLKYIQVICIGMNYVDHCTEQGFPIPTGKPGNPNMD